MRLLRIIKSPVAGKKHEAQFEDEKTGRIRRVQFGAAGMKDFTRGATPEEARLFRLRHAKDLKTNDPTRPGYLSMFVLWASPDFDANVRAYKKKFDL